MNINISMVFKILIGVTGYGVWALMAWKDPTLRPDFLKFNVIMATGTIGLVLRDMQAPAPAGSAPATASAAPAVPSGQSGFTYIAYMVMLVGLALGAVASLAGCASMMDAGHTAYSVEPVLGPDGRTTGYKFNATDGKEYSSRNINVIHDAQGGIVVQVQEGASTAFQGQAIAEKALSILPSFAPMQLPPGPASILPGIPLPIQALPAVAPGAL